MSSSAQTLVLIPAFNEEQSIAGVMDGLRKFGYTNVLVVDDGSDDDTSGVASRSGATVLRHPINQGVGAAIKTGLSYALKHNIKQVVQIDGDGQHNPVSIDKLICQTKGDLVIGQRDFADYQMNRTRQIGRYAMVLLLRVNGITGIHDPTSGFRLFRLPAIKVLSKEMPSNFFGDTLETLIIAKKHGLFIEGAEVQMSHRLLGESSYSGIRLAKAFLASVAYSLGYWKPFHGE